MKINKTNAARLLDKAKIAYELIPYEVDENDLSASVIVHNIGFTAKQTAHAEFFPRQDLKVAEIQFAAAARHFRRMLRKRNSRQPDLCCLSCHFIYCVISVSACNRMCMCIN